MGDLWGRKRERRLEPAREAAHFSATPATATREAGRPACLRDTRPLPIHWVAIQAMGLSRSSRQAWIGSGVREVRGP
jgi:hypothetical protein